MLKALIIATVLLPTLAIAQRSQQLPQPRQPGQWCPQGWMASGSYCVPGSHKAPQAIPKNRSAEGLNYNTLYLEPGRLGVSNLSNQTYQPINLSTYQPINLSTMNRYNNYKDVRIEEYSQMASGFPDLAYNASDDRQLDLGPNAISLDLLQAVYRDPTQQLST